MQLDVVQRKIVESKPHSISLIKGGPASGKTTAAVYRAQYLKNNYCLFENDKILMIVQDDLKKKIAEELLKANEQWSNIQYMSLFSDNKNCIEILTRNEILDKFLDTYSYYANESRDIVEDINTKKDIMTECISIIKNKYKKSKLLKNNYSEFFIDEVSWMKACGYSSLKDYQNAERIGRKPLKGTGPSRLIKNSEGREIVYELSNIYNNRLSEMGLMDEEDKILYILTCSKLNKLNYTHIILDESEKFTKSELDIIKNLSNNKPYSSLMLILNNSKLAGKNQWLLKNRKSNQLGFGVIPKTFLLKSKFQCEEIEANMKQNKDNNLLYIENYEYRDIRHNRKYDFTIDTSNIGEVIINSESNVETCSKDEVKSIPMYSDIAAGEPIYINDELESNFYIPDFWLKGMKDCFILKVKGDSMIGADINDGDYVVIRKQYTAQNGDIVAADLDGSATLKRLSIKKEGAMLMPENEKYKPISMSEEHAAILGIAVGIIKNKH